LKWASVRRQKELAQRRAELELSRIQSEQQQFSSDDEMSPPNTFMFNDLSISKEKSEEWVNPSPYNGPNSRLEKEYEATGRSAFGPGGGTRRHDYGPPSYHSRSSSEEYLNADHPLPQKSSTGVSELVEALKMAFPRNDNRMAKILAHQSVAKDLPEFTGNPSEWPRFLTRFKETNKLFEFSNENLSRLIKALKGKAKQVAQALMIHSNNVPMIRSTLERNFGRPDFIESLIEKRLLSIQEISLQLWSLKTPSTTF
jgi:hypothetical protein